MTAHHGGLIRTLDRMLVLQLEALVPGEYEVSAGTAKVRVAAATFYIPDLCVLPRELVLRKQHETPTRLEVYEEPLPLVVEVWSPSTGDYDVEEKLREYQRRGDTEIWRIHPYERTLTAWRRQPDGGYTESLQNGGEIRPIALPGVTIEIDRLFD
jgi:Uma2 family endonuclease